MRIAVTGATGNVGTSLLAALQTDDAVDEIVGVARRAPTTFGGGKVRWLELDVGQSATELLQAAFRGADAVVHLAWLIQPSRDPQAMADANLRGSDNVFRAVAEVGVPSLVYASSVGAYSPGPKDHPVDESWPTHGVASSAYSWQKAYVERLLDAFELAHPDVRVVRVRPGLIFKRGAATGIRRLFMGPFVPPGLFRKALLPVVPDLPAFQAVHSVDVGEAYRLAIRNTAFRGAVNIAADPVLDGRALARLLGARVVPVPRPVLRGATSAAWMAHLVPADAGWLDLAWSAPIMSTDRARTELGWTPRHSSEEAVGELLGGLRESAGLPTPPLDPATSGPGRAHELATGVGSEPR